MLCLRTDHVLSIICPDTLLGLKIYDDPVFDFTIIQHDDIDHCDILFLSQSGNNCTMYKLCLVSYPGTENYFYLHRVFCVFASYVDMPFSLFFSLQISSNDWRSMFPLLLIYFNICTIPLTYLTWKVSQLKMELSIHLE